MEGLRERSVKASGNSEARNRSESKNDSVGAAQGAVSLRAIKLFILSSLSQPPTTTTTAKNKKNSNRGRARAPSSLARSG